MTITTSGRALLAAGLVLAATTSGPAPAARADPGYVLVHFCNETGDDLYLAVAHYDKPLFGELIVRGWGKVPAHACIDQDIPRGAPLYTYADDGDPEYKYDGDTRFCVPQRSFNRADNGENLECPDDERSLLFTSHILPWEDTYTVTFSD